MTGPRVFDRIDAEHVRDPFLVAGGADGFARLPLLAFAERSLVPTFEDIGCVLGSAALPVPPSRARENTAAVRAYVAAATAAGRAVRLRGSTHETSLDYDEPALFSGAKHGLALDWRGTRPRNLRTPGSAFGEYYVNLENLTFPHASESYAAAGVFQGARTPRYHGPRLASAPAGATRVVLAAGEAMPADVTAGEIVEIYGGARQPAGFPEHTYVHHRAVVTAVEGREVAFDAPLETAIDARWPELPGGGGGRGGGGGGAPRLRSWNRPGAFVGMAALAMHGYRPLPNPSWNGGTAGSPGPERIARLSTAGIRAVHIAGAETASGFYPGQSDLTLVEDSSFGAVEADKGIGTVRFRRCRLGQWVATGGAAVAALEDCCVDGAVGFGGWARTELTGNTLSGRGWGTTFALFKVPFGGLSLLLSGNRFAVEDAAVTSAVAVETASYPGCRRAGDGLLDLGVAAAGYWETTLHRNVFWGKLLVLPDGRPAARARGLPIAVDGRICVAADLLAPLAAPATLAVAVLSRITDTGDNVFGAGVSHARLGFPAPSTILGRSGGRGVFLADAGADRSADGALTLGLPEDALVTDISVFVLTPEEGGRPLLFRLRPGAGVQLAIDPRRAGLRRVSLGGAPQRQEGDLPGWAPLPSAVTGRIEVVRGAGATLPRQGSGERAYWVLRADYLPLAAEV